MRHRRHRAVAGSRLARQITLCAGYLLVNLLLIVLLRDAMAVVSDADKAGVVFRTQILVKQGVSRAAERKDHGFGMPKVSQFAKQILHVV